MSSSVYGISTSIGSQSFAGFVNTPIQGPLNTNQYPNAMPYHSYGTLSGIRPTPPQFYPNNMPVNATMNTNMRRQYIQSTSVNPYENAYQSYLGKMSRPITKVNYSTQRKIPVSTHVNYVEPIPSSMLVNIKKSIAIGKSAYKIGLPLFTPITTKNVDVSSTRSTLRKVRSSGCVAPKKKGSIYNYNLTQPGINAWGAIPRQNY